MDTSAFAASGRHHTINNRGPSKTQRRTHEEVGRLHAVVVVGRLLARGEPAFGAEREGGDAVHVVVRSAVRLEVRAHLLKPLLNWKVPVETPIEL